MNKTFRVELHQRQVTIRDNVMVADVTAADVLLLVIFGRDINKGKKYALAHFMLPLTTDRYFPDFN